MFHVYSYASRFIKILEYTKNTRKLLSRLLSKGVLKVIQNRNTKN
jgi:hypothetical protein